MESSQSPKEVQDAKETSHPILMETNAEDNARTQIISTEYPDVFIIEAASKKHPSKATSVRKKMVKQPILKKTALNMPTLKKPVVKKIAHALCQTPQRKRTTDTHVDIRVRSPSGNLCQFNLKKTSSMDTLFKRYCQRLNMAYGSFRFFFDGDRLKKEDTPQSLKLEQLDIIDAMILTTGGCIPY